MSILDRGNRMVHKALADGTGGAILASITCLLLRATLPQVPFLISVVESAIANLVASLAQQGGTRLLNSAIKQSKNGDVNHDLQREFRTAVIRAIIDIGGPECFADVADRGNWTVPDEVLYRVSSYSYDIYVDHGDLTAQAHSFLRAIRYEILKGNLVPVSVESGSTTDISVTAYIDKNELETLSTQFINALLNPKFIEGNGSPVIGLRSHLNKHLLKRTLIHFGELLKSPEHTEAWRAYLRDVMLNVRTSVNEVHTDTAVIKEGQQEIVKRLEIMQEALNSGDRSAGRIDLADVSADILTDFGHKYDQISGEMDEILQEIAKQHKMEQFWHHEIMAKLKEQGIEHDEQNKKHDEQIEKHDEQIKMLIEIIALLKAKQLQMSATSPEIAVRLRNYLDAAAQKHNYRFSNAIGNVFSTAVSLSSTYVDQLLVPADNLRRKQVSALSSAVASHALAPSDVLRQSKCVLVLGEPGSGKSTLLHWLALGLAKNCNISPNGNVDGYIPIYIDLRMNKCRDLDPGITPAKHLMNFIVLNQAHADPFLEVMAQSGRLAFFFDALDESGDAAWVGKVIEQIQALAELWPECLFIVTSRTANYHGSYAKLQIPFRVFELLPMSEATQRGAIRQWMLEVATDDYELVDWQKLRADALYKELDERPGLRQALRNPLMLKITVAVYDDQSHVPCLGERFDVYVKKLLTLRGAWEIHDQAFICLEEIAWALHNNQNRITVQEAGQILVSKKLLEHGTTANFLKRMEDEAGLLVRSSSHSFHTAPGPDDILSIGPHAMFQDYLVGRHLWREWQKDQHSVEKVMYENAGLLDWQPAILFCLGLIHTQAKNRQAAFRFVRATVQRDPLLGVRCLQEGLELTCDDPGLPKSERNQMRELITAQARKVLKPGIGILSLNLAQASHLVSDINYFTALNKQFDAVRALGRLRDPESAPQILQGAFWLGYESKAAMHHAFREALLDFGPEILWPMMRGYVETDDDYIHGQSAYTVSLWRGKKAIEPLRWLLEQGEEHRYQALSGLAAIDLPEARSIFEEALKDPATHKVALEAGLVQHYPGLFDVAIDAVRSGEFGDDEIYHVRGLLDYFAEMPADDAANAMALLLKIPYIKEQSLWIFESPENNVAILGALSMLLQREDSNIVEAADNVIWRVMKNQEYDPQVPETRQVLERIFMYSPEWWKSGAEHLHGTDLSSQACDEIIGRLDWESDLCGEMLRRMLSIRQYSAVDQDLLVKHLRQGLELPRWRYWAALALSSLKDKTAAPALLEELDRADNAVQYDARFVWNLAKMRVPEVYPYLWQMMKSEHYLKGDCTIAFSLLYPELTNHGERREVVGLLNSQLKDEEWHQRLRAIHLLGNLGIVDALPAMVAELTKGHMAIAHPLEESVIGGALGKLAHCDLKKVSERISELFASREGHLCNAAIYAWGLSGECTSASSLISVFTTRNNFLKSTNVIGFQKKPGGTVNYLKANSAMLLGRLAIDLSKISVYDEKYGWKSIINELSPDRTVLNQDTLSVLEEVINSPTPARGLYESMIKAKGERQECLAWLLGAYEWSEVLSSMAKCGMLENVGLWESLKAIFEQPEPSEQGIDELAERIRWTKPAPPFRYLLALNKLSNSMLSGMPKYNNHRQIDEYIDYLKWLKQFTTLRVD